MTRILNYIWRLWFLVLGIILTFLLGIPIYLLSFRESHYKWCYAFIRLWCLGMFYGMGFRYELIKLTHKKIEKEGKYVIISNHTSMIDVFLPCIMHPEHPLSYVGKKELEKIPVFGSIYKKVCVTVDRKNAQSRAEVYTKCAERIEEGKNIVIFPEGGVPDDTSVVLADFKDGAFILSSKYQYPIVVYTYVGPKEMFPFDNAKGYPGKIKVYLNDIIEPQQNVRDLKNNAWQQIKATLDKHS